MRSPMLSFMLDATLLDEYFQRGFTGEPSEQLRQAYEQYRKALTEYQDTTDFAIRTENPESRALSLLSLASDVPALLFAQQTYLQLLFGSVAEQAVAKTLKSLRFEIAPDEVPLPGGRTTPTGVRLGVVPGPVPGDPNELAGLPRPPAPA